MSNVFEDAALPVPPMDQYGLDLGIGDRDNDLNFEFTFDDNFYFPSETEDFLADLLNDEPHPVLVEPVAPDNRIGDNNCPSPESGNSNDFHSLSSELFNSSDNDRNNNNIRENNNNFSSGGNIKNDLADVKNDSDGGVVSETVSSQGSGNGINCRSPGKDVSSSVEFNKNKIKTERKCFIKRKKENEGCDGDEYNVDSRSSKFHRSSVENSAGNGTEDEKRTARLMRNRESAQLSRQRKKHYVEELEDKVRAMHSAMADLNSRISFVMAENASLRQQLVGGAAGGAVGMCPHPPGMYPPPHPMGYPWMPYVVKPQGSQVPLVPIPRLKTQQPVAPTSSRVKKSDNKKNEGKTKKVASISFLGLLFFILLFGGLVPLVNNKHGGFGEEVYGQRDGRILTVSGHRNGSGYGTDSPGFSKGNEKLDFDKRILYESGKTRGQKVEPKQKKQGSDGHIQSGNLSEPLVASLYVPRNDKLVKIDGNLIIHSVLASEKAMASYKASTTKEKENTGLAIATNLAPKWAFTEAGLNRGHSHLYGNPNERQRALSSGSTDSFKDHVKSTAADGKLQQWFREGLAGPMLSSGMCTEVFQFDASPASNPGGIIPAPPVNNTSTDHSQNSINLNKGKNRRILHGLPLPFNSSTSTLNISEDHVKSGSHKENFSNNKSLSSMVVSVLVDPREAGDGEGDGVMGPKSISRIFVVVLMDSVKYVTYSCVLPLMGSSPHLTA